MEETNGQGAGSTAGAGRERRESDVRYVEMVVGERGSVQQEESGMWKWKKGRI